ncbi:MAG: HAMP domain-containing histidine kinase [Coriobacteriia bacterium]|nr:HAMP domain-containing histidine kinase [Coriobacteriia bacterium]
MTDSTTNTASTDEALVKIVVGDRQVTPAGVTAEIMDKLSNMLKVDNNVIKVILLLGAYIFALMMISSGGHIFFRSIFSWDSALVLFAMFSMPTLYFLLKWSRIIHFIRKPLNGIISAFTTLAFAVGIVFFWVITQQVFWGEFNFILIAISALIIFAVAYLNSFLFSLNAIYEQKYEEAHQDKIRAERLKSELITNVSHDIQTPLTSIINYSGLLQNLSRDDEEFDKKFNDYVEVLDRKSIRLKVLTSDLIEASKAATGNISIDVQPVNLTELVWQVAGEFDGQFTRRNLSFVLIPTDTQFTASADPRHLWRILENLFSNMAKYSLEGTRTFAQFENVQQSGHTGMVKLILKNTSSEPLDQTGDELTEQFMRGDKSRHTEGSGLGLYIAKSLAELMGGRLAVQVSGDQFEVNLWLKT